MDTDTDTVWVRIQILFAKIKTEASGIPCRFMTADSISVSGVLCSPGPLNFCLELSKLEMVSAADMQY